jgi:hypothetical protein
LRRVDPGAATAERFCGAGGGGQQRVGLLIDVVEKSDSFSPGHRLEQHANISKEKSQLLEKMYFFSKIKKRFVSFFAVLPSGSGIRCLLNPGSGIRDG